MLAIQKQQKYIQKAVQLPNGAWVMVVFELVERDGHIIAHAVSGKLLDDIENKTIAAASEAEIKNVGKLKRQQIAQEVGKLIAEKAKALTVKSVVFDRGGNAYHGRVKALAEGAREAGLEF